MNSKAKGDRGEREAAKYLNSLLGTACIRGRQRSGLEQADVVDLPGFHVEVKRVEKLNITTAMDQAIRDSEGKVDLPMVLHRKNRKPWMITILGDDLFEFVRRIGLIQDELGTTTD